MGRHPKPYWDDRAKAWRSLAVGPISEKTGRRIGVRNRDIGPPTGRDGPKNKALAQAWLVGLIEEGDGPRTSSDPTLAELAEAYLRWCEPRKARTTLDGYRDRLTALCRVKDAKSKALGGRLARSLTASDMEHVAAKLAEAGMSPVRVRDVLGAGRACTSWAARETPGRDPIRYLSADPLRDARGPRVPAPPKRYAGGVARNEFFGACLVRLSRIDPDREPMTWRFDRLAVAHWRFVEATGARPSEACRLRWEHIDWRGRVAVMPGKSTGTTGRNRRVPLTASVVRLLRAIHALPGRHPDYVFTHARRDGNKDGDLAGVPWVTRAIAHKFADWRDEFAAAGLAIHVGGPHALTLYQLRRDVGADVLRMTGSHAESAEVLGHSPEVNARHYASFEANRAADLAERMERRRAESAVTPTPPAVEPTSPPRPGAARDGRTEPEPD